MILLSLSLSLLFVIGTSQLPKWIGPYLQRIKCTPFLLRATQLPHSIMSECTAWSPIINRDARQTVQSVHRTRSVFHDSAHVPNGKRGPTQRRRAAGGRAMDANERVEWAEGRAGKQEANGHARDTHGAWCARETSCHSGQRHATAGDYEIKESRENGLLIYLSGLTFS